MDINFYSQIRKNWQYLHPVTRAIAYTDYHLEKLIAEVDHEIKEIFKIENLKFFYWIPRIAGIIFIIFLSSFALDVFHGYKSASLMIDSAISKLIPTFLMLIMLAIAWKKELLGGFLFEILFVLIFGLVISENPLPSDIVFFGPLPIIGTLFLIDNYLRNSCKLK